MPQQVSNHNLHRPADLDMASLVPADGSSGVASEANHAAHLGGRKAKLAPGLFEFERVHLP
jgi:hypothetical protein